MKARLTANVEQACKYATGETIVRKGSFDRKLYVLLKGSLGVYEDTEPSLESCLTVLNPGDFFGEMALFTGKAANATVAVLSDATLLVFDKNDICELFKKQPRAAVEMVQSLCYRTGELVRLLGTQPIAASSDVRRTLIPEAAYGIPPYTETPEEETNPWQAQEQEYGEQSSQQGGGTSTEAEGLSSETPHFESAAANQSPLFPPGHGHYGRTKKPHDGEYLRDKTLKCPMCRTEFKVTVPRSSKVISESTDDDLRVHYRAIEPMYYEVCSCPNCLYSALTDLFAKGFQSRATAVKERLAPFKNGLPAKWGCAPDMDTIFTSYYLALQCAHLCFDAHVNITAMLWQKLTRLYADCGDEKMRAYANKETYQAYLEVYQNANVSGEKAQRLYIAIGECALAEGQQAEAKRFFYLAKVEKGASAMLKEHADRRIEDMRAGTT